MTEQGTPARKMLMLFHEDMSFGVRVAGVLVHDGRVLLHRGVTDDFWALPGGRVELLERSPDALRREMQEELGITVKVERLLWVVENYFEHNDRECHEVGFYYLMSAPPDTPLLQQPESYGYEDQLALHLIFRWFSLDALPGLRLYPTFLRDGLRALPETTVHVIHRDTE
jgi:ADP-ribose pyrophosphatase YjhB (NUDIX family)